MSVNYESDRETLAKVKKQVLAFHAQHIAVMHRLDMAEERERKLSQSYQTLLQRVNQLTEIVMKYEDNKQLTTKGELPRWDS